MATRWSHLEDDILIEYASSGAKVVSALILSVTGHERSVSAVQNRAFDLGISLAKVEECEVCRRPVKETVGTTGLCRVCYERHMSRVTRERWEEARRGYTPEDERLISEYRRERNRYRKSLQRELDKQEDLKSARAKENQKKIGNSKSGDLSG